MGEFVYEEQMLRRGIERGTLVVSMAAMHEFSALERAELHESLLPAIRGLTARAGSMTVHGLESSSVASWGKAVESSLVPLGNEVWRVDPEAQVFVAEPDFVCRIPRPGVHNGVFAWIFDGADGDWLGLELRRLGTRITTTDPFKAMIPSMKRMFQRNIQEDGGAICMEFGRFSNGFRVVTAPPVPQGFVAGLLG